MSWIEALILGLVQGFTEYLPVSSSGHLEIANALFGTESEENLTFAVIVHAATVCSTIVVLWSEVAILFRGFFQFKWNDETKYVSKILLSMIPVGVVGLFFKDYVEAFFGSNIAFVGSMLLITAALLAFSYYAKPRSKEEITYKDAFIIGIAQACAVLPGISRSGSTIATGLLLGDKKEQVAKFSFLMVVIPILGNLFLDIISGDLAHSTLPISAMIIGFISAFVSGAVACKWMLNIVRKGKLIYFAIYCVIMGLIAIISSLV